MYITNNLKKSIYISHSVNGSFQTILALSKYRDNGFKKIDLEFKNGSRFESVNLGTAWMLTNYYYWSKRFSCFDISDLNILNEIGEQIYLKLKEKFKTWRSGLWGLLGTHGIVFMMVRKFKPETIIETGIAHGYSAEIILEALSLNGKGRLKSIDIDKKVHIEDVEVDVGWIVSPSLLDRWDMITGDSKVLLDTISEHPDIFIHDSLHTEDHMLFEYSWAKNHLKTNGFLISDDIDRNRAWKIFHSINKDFKEYLKTPTTGVSQKTT
jgi:hypothetical protein